MKALSFLFSLLLLGSLSAGAVAAQRTKAAGTRAQCLQECFDEYIDDLDDCQDMCFVCDVWILICVAGHTNQDCMEECSENAEDEYDECKAACPPAPTPTPTPAAG